jgi:hypothetical protein
MKIRLDAGVEMDLLSPDEFSKGLEAHNRSWFEEMAAGVKHLSLPLASAVPAAGAVSIGASVQPDGTIIGPREGYVWSLERITVSGLKTGDTVQLWKSSLGMERLLATLTPPPSANRAVGGLWGVFLAGAAGGVTLPNTYAYLTGFDVTTDEPVANVTSVVTAAAGASFFTYDMVQNAVGGGLLQVRYPLPGISVGAAGATVAVAATVGGAAGNINVYGAGGVGMSATWTPSSRAPFLRPGETLIVTGTGLLTTDRVFVSGEAIEVPGPKIWKLLGA